MDTNLIAIIPLIIGVWKDVGMKIENFSREHVDIAIKGIYESDYDKNKIFNGMEDNIYFISPIGNL